MSSPRFFLGFIFALFLSILPIPYDLSAFRPPWVLLLLLYIKYFFPSRLGVISLVWIGLMMDVLLSTVLGEHSFALVLVYCLASTNARRFQFFSLVHQFLAVGFLCFSYQAIIVVIDMLLGFNYNLYMPLISALVGMFLWPSVRVFGELFLKNTRYCAPHILK